MTASDRPIPNPTRDWCNESGATALKAIIEAHWRARGWIVTATLEQAGFLSVMRGRRYDIRSDLVNGAPRVVASERSEAA